MEWTDLDEIEMYYELEEVDADIWVINGEDV